MTERKKPAQKRQKPKQDDPEQSKRFVETARQLEADESGETFRRAFEKIIPSRPATSRTPG